MERLILGNAASMLGALFLIMSSISPHRIRIYIFQLAECIFLIISQLLFMKPGAAVVLFIAIIRNLLLIKGKYSRQALIIISASTLLFGILFSDKSYISLLPVLAAFVYNFAAYRSESIVLLKLGLSLTLALWLVYSAAIFDVFGFAVNGISLVLNIVSLTKIEKSG